MKTPTILVHNTNSFDEGDSAVQLLSKTFHRVLELLRPEHVLGHFNLHVFSSSPGLLLPQHVPPPVLVHNAASIMLFTILHWLE